MLPLEVAPMPYKVSALQPYLSAPSVLAHRVLHYRYANAVNEMLGPTYARAKTLEDLVALADELGDQVMYDAAAQVWSHTLMWDSMTPRYLPPSATLVQFYRSKYVDTSPFYTAAQRVSDQLFGSGWLWLTFKDGSLSWVVTPDAQIPTFNVLLAIDLWEHAYYFDFMPTDEWGPSARARYVRVLLEKLVNWQTAATRLSTLLAFSA